MSDPGYGDLFLKNKQDPERVVGTCFVAPGTRNTRTRTRGKIANKRNTRARTRGNSVHTLLIELLYNSSSE